jgi:hypothetical protein
MPLLRALEVTALFATLSVAFAIGAAVLRKWSAAVVAARWALILSITTLAVWIVAGIRTWRNPSALSSALVGPAVDPDQKARALAEGIATATNCSAVSLLAFALSAALWAFAHSQKKKP